MTQILLANNATALLAAPILAADTSLTLQNTDAALFPQPTASGDYFFLVLEDRRVVPNLREIVSCTQRAGAVFTIVRAQEGTTAHDFFIGAVVSLRLTAATIFNVRAEEAALRLAGDQAEAAARIAGILVETTRAEAAETALQTALATAIAAEQTARRAADTAETAARIAADSAEVVARNAAIAVVATNLANEIAARGGAVSAETARAEAAEALLNAQLSAAIAAEAARAKAAEAALAGAKVQSGTWTGGTVGGHVRVTFPTPYATACTAFLAGIAGGGLFCAGVTTRGDATGGDVWLQMPWGAPAQDGLPVYWIATGF